MTRASLIPAGIAAALLFVSAGCASLQPAAEVGRSAVDIVVEHLRRQAGGAAPAYRSILDTELAGLFGRHPVTDASRPPAWPRVALTFKSAPVYATKGGYFQFAQPQASDCVAFDAVVWHDERRSVRHADLRLCADFFATIQGQSNGALMLWPARQAWPFWKNTGSVRTEGPNRPFTNAPNDPRSNPWFAPGGTPFMSYLSAVLRQLGYNWDDLNDRRVWIVSVPAG